MSARGCCFLALKTAQDVQPVRWRLWREEVWDRAGGPARTVQKFHGPFRHAFLVDVAILAGLRLVELFALQDERQWCF